MPPERSALAGRRGSGLGGQQARPGRRGRTHLALRLARGGLLIAAGAIHLDLYLTGYRSIPTIGWLFLLQVITAFGLGAVVLVPAGSLTAAASAVLAAGQGTGDRGPWCHRQARDDHALGWLGSGHLRRASAVHYVGDGAPGQANGNELNLNGGLWHEVTASSRYRAADARSLQRSSRLTEQPGPG